MYITLYYCCCNIVSPKYLGAYLYLTAALYIMIGASAGASAASAVGSAAANGVGALVSGVLFGGFNPRYSKEHCKKMRYIQQKYAEAYGDSGCGDGDPNTIIHNCDANSKLKMTPEGARPANPFPDERAFDEALTTSFHPSPGHQGKFCASHANASLGVIVQYQKNRCIIRNADSSYN